MQIPLKIAMLLDRQTKEMKRGALNITCDFEPRLLRYSKPSFYNAFSIQTVRVFVYTQQFICLTYSVN